MLFADVDAAEMLHRGSVMTFVEVQRGRDAAFTLALNILTILYRVAFLCCMTVLLCGI